VLSGVVCEYVCACGESEREMAGGVGRRDKEGEHTQSEENNEG
jgi:hypothetical protein